MESTLKGKNCSMGANAFLYEMIPIYMGGNNENDRVAFLESVPIHLKMHWYNFAVFLFTKKQNKF